MIKKTEMANGAFMNEAYKSHVAYGPGGAIVAVIVIVAPM